MGMFGGGRGDGGVGFPKIEQGGKLKAPAPTHTNRLCTQWAGTQGNCPVLHGPPPSSLSLSIYLYLSSPSFVPFLLSLLCVVRISPKYLFLFLRLSLSLCLVTEEHGQGMTVWTRLSPFLLSQHEVRIQNESTLGHKLKDFPQSCRWRLGSRPLS
ncbi:hypothetical protein CGRA01v4_13186 [Colletotrichum graminicola]|nr:hypothetical protein CGRA01v4_13186 [Colletotrichum graminicola]